MSIWNTLKSWFNTPSPTFAEQFKEIVEQEQAETKPVEETKPKPKRKPRKKKTEV